MSFTIANIVINLEFKMKVYTKSFIFAQRINIIKT